MCGSTWMDAVNLYFLSGLKGRLIRSRTSRHIQSHGVAGNPHIPPETSAAHGVVSDSLYTREPSHHVTG
jgi:hypothetical protein